MDSCTLETGTSSSSSPFSVAEFGNLVAFAFQLESQDRLSQTLLQFGKGLDGGGSPEKSYKLQTRAAPSTSCRSTTPGSQASTTALSNMDFVAAPALCQPHSPSRPRQLLNKIKRHASIATPIRHEVKERRTTIVQPRISTTSLSRQSPVSFFEDSSDSDDDYTPPSRSPSIAIHRPETPKATTPHSGFSIFSRPPSAISRPGTFSGRDSPDSLPPSPVSTRARSNSSSSTASTITDHVCRTPTTPLFLTSGSAATRSSPAIASNRWSLYADDMPHSSQPPSPSEDSSLYSAYSFSEHPFAVSCEEEDPFAKNAVQVIRNHSIVVPGANSKPKRSRRRRRSPPSSLPPTPPPSCPLPAPPPPGVPGEEGDDFLTDMTTTSASEPEASITSSSSSSSSSDDESLSECDGSCEGSCDDENCDWTLGLGALPRDDEQRLSALKKCKGRRRSTTITAESMKRDDEVDWTLSLPLKKVAFPGSTPRPDDVKSEEEDVVRPASPLLAAAPASKSVYARRRRPSGAVRMSPAQLTIRPPALVRSPSQNSTTSATLPSGSELRVPSFRTSHIFPSQSALATGTSAAFKLPASYPNTPSGSGDESTDTFRSALSSPSRYSQSSLSRYSLTSAFPTPPATRPAVKSLSSVQGYPFPAPPATIPVPLRPTPPRPPRSNRTSALLPIGPSSSSSSASSFSSSTSLQRTIRKSASSVGSQSTISRSLKSVKSERHIRSDSVYHTARESMSSQASSM